MTDLPAWPSASGWSAGEADRPAPILLAFGEPFPQQRLTVLFRFILLIPHYFVLYVLSVAAEVIAVIGWFAALFTGRLPEFAADFLSGYLRWQTRVTAYMLLLTDEYPPFSLDDAGYPVRVALRPGRLNRLAVFFRLILAVPAAIVTTLLYWGACTIALFVAWLIVLITGRMPAVLYAALAAVLRYLTRYSGYMLLLTSAYPSGLFGDQPEPGQAWTPGGPGGFTAGPDVFTAGPGGFAGPVAGFATDSGGDVAATPGGFPSPAAENSAGAAQHWAAGAEHGAGGAEHGAGGAEHGAGGAEHQAGTGEPPAGAPEIPAGTGAHWDAGPGGQAGADPAGEAGGSGAVAGPAGFTGRWGPGGPGGGFAYPGPAGSGRLAGAAPLSWQLVLSDGAKRLVALFLVLGGLGVAGFVALLAVSAANVHTSVRNTVTATNAASQAETALAPLNQALNSFGADTSQCRAAASPLNCATAVDRRLAHSFDTFAAQLRKISMPPGAAMVAAGQLGNAAVRAGLTFHRLGTATSAERYRAVLSTVNIEQGVNQFAQDYEGLGKALNQA
jgi:hypothetical protein